MMTRTWWHRRSKTQRTAVAITAIGTAIGVLFAGALWMVVTIGTLEHQYGFAASWLGHARKSDVDRLAAEAKVDNARVLAWQLYSDLGRHRRQIEMMNERKAGAGPKFTWEERQRLQGLVDQERKMSAEYDRVLKVLGQGPLVKPEQP